MLCPVPTPRRRPRAPRPSGRGPGLAALLLALVSAPAAASEPPAASESATAREPATATEPAAATEPASEPATTSEPAAATEPAAPPPLGEARIPATRPPRVDGPFLGLTLGASGSLARVNDFPTPNPLTGSAASLRVGEALYPWLTIGLEIAGTWAYRFADPRQRLLQGAALIDFGFLPVPRIPLSLHVGFGAGGGAVRQAGRSARSGFGGAVFTGAVRYEIFPLAARRRPTRGGGFALGPELGWLGFTPAARGRPMSNTLYLGLFVGFYFGS